MLVSRLPWAPCAAGFGERVAELLAEEHRPGGPRDGLSRDEAEAARAERGPRDDDAAALALLAAGAGGGVAPPLAFRVAADRFEAQAAHDAVVHAHGALSTLAVSLHKVRCGGQGEVRPQHAGRLAAQGEVRWTGEDLTAQGSAGRGDRLTAQGSAGASGRPSKRTL